MAGRFGLEGVREVGSRSGERRRGGAAVTRRGIARQSSQRRKTRGRDHASVRERKGEGRVGRLKATGPADRWAGAG
jgi:hypothetical protein